MTSKQCGAAIAFEYKLAVSYGLGILAMGDSTELSAPSDDSWMSGSAGCSPFDFFAVEQVVAVDVGDAFFFVLGFRLSVLAEFASLLFPLSIAAFCLFFCLVCLLAEMTVGCWIICEWHGGDVTIVLADTAGIICGVRGTCPVNKISISSCRFWKATSRGDRSM